MTDKQAKPKWIKSDAKGYLRNLLTKGDIPNEMRPKQVHQHYCKDRPEFEPFGDKNFASRLKSLRDKVKDRNDKTARDAAALTRDRNTYPRPVMDGFGLPHWPDCDAKELLEQDVNDKRHETLTRQALWESRPECMENFPFDMFVKHVHQAMKTRKFHAYVDDKKNNRIAKKDLENVPFSKQ